MNLRRLASALFCAATLWGQPFEVVVNVRNPAPLSLETWRTDPRVVTLQVFNQGTSERRIVLGIELINRTTNQSAKTNIWHPCMPVFTIPARGMTTIFGPQLICEASLEIDPGIRTAVATAGAIPEGDYQFCVTVYDADNRNIRYTDVGQFCATTRVTWPEPPVLIYPLSSDPAQRCDQPIILRWQPLSPPPPTPVRYRVRAVGMFEGQTPRQALDAATPTETVVDDVTLETNYRIAPNNSVLLDLAQRRAPRLVGIAWQVEAQDENGTPIPTRGGTRGRSDIGSFAVECPNAGSTASCTGPMTLGAYYPLNADTIPWVPPLMVVQWGPYCEDVVQMQYHLIVMDIREGGPVYDNERVLRWPRGPIDGQGLTGQPNAQERARLIIVNQWDEGGNFVAWNRDLRRGTTYRWGVNARLTRREGRDEREHSVTTGVHTFNLGLRMPTNPNPPNGATVTERRGLSLSWHIPEPAGLTREFIAELLTLRGGGRAGMAFAEAAEVVRVVVSRDSTFRTPVASRTLRFPASGNYISFDERVREIFGTKRAEWRDLNLSDGVYYWRVEYYDPSDTLTPYRRGPIWRFQVGSGVTAEECFRLRPSNPAHRATISVPRGGAQIPFEVTAEPPIRLSEVTVCRFRIWEMTRPDEDPATVRSRSPLLDITQNRRDGSLQLRELSNNGSIQRIALELINTPAARHTFTPTIGRTYLWECELQFQGERIRADGTPCTLREKRCEAVFTARSSECDDPCVATPPSNTTPFSGSLNPGDIIRIGHFEAVLEQVSGSPSRLSGQALVRLPWFDLRVRARFENIAVNTDRQVYEGELEAVQEEDSPIPEELANRLTGGLGLDSAQLARIHEYITSRRRLVSLFVDREVKLPLGFDRTIDGFQYTIGLIGMVFRPDGAYLNAVQVIRLNLLDREHTFGVGARNICFSPNGIGRSVELYLAEDRVYTTDGEFVVKVKAQQRDGGGGAPADSGTYVRFSCAGFEFLRVAVDVEFPRSWMLPSPDNGRDKVTLRLRAHVRNTGDFLATGTITPFSPSGAPGFVFTCDNVAVDCSDRDNPPDISFPPGYRGETTTRWRGFYLNRLSMRFPEGIRGWRGSEPPSVGIQNVIIDRSGVNFDIVALNILRYPEGNLGGWGGSIDTIGLRVLNSSLESGWMSGSIRVPVSDSALAYSAILRDTTGGIRFEFTVRPRGRLNIPMWAGTLELENTSWVRIAAGAGTHGGFAAQANFTGHISFGGTRDIPLNMGGISFQEMQIQTHQRPYITVRHWSFASPPHSILGSPEPEPPPSGGSGSGSRSAGGFPISIRGFDLVSGDRREGLGIGVRIGIDVNLQPGGAGISGGTTISIWGALSTGRDSPPSFVFSGIDLDSIGIRADMGAVEIEGSVRFYNNDRTYGNGFRGAVQANFVRMVRVEATVQFGSISAPQAYRYWYVDARALIASGIPVFSGVAIYGFGGGAWYNMVRASDPSAINPTGGSETRTTASSASPGSTNSGARYVPSYSDRGETFGFYALVTIGTHPEPKAFNCDVRLEVSFAGGGIREISLRGDGWMLAGLMERGQAPVRATAEISYNFPERTFFGQFGLSVNLEAATASGRMVLFFSPETWHIKIGDPEGERIRVEVLRIITLQAYFMAGMNLPSIPPIPPEVLELTGPVPAPVRPEALGRGNGFAFGAMADFNPGELRFLIFYASMRFLVGFDMALLDYGITARCADGRPMGANGWYATGQMYARLDASIGLFVDLWFVSGKFEILGMRVGSVLQAGLPNPTWIAGAVGGHYSILGGAVSGYCNFQFTLGERCVPLTESPLASLEMISDVAPSDGSEDVSVFAEPTAFFNLKPDRPFALEEMRDDGSRATKVYRIRVGTFRLLRQDTRGNFSVTVPTTQVDRSTPEAPAVALVPNEPLLGLTRYRVEVSAYGQEYTGSGFARREGETVEQASERAARELASSTAWSDVRYRRGDRAGQRIEQRVTATFTTQPRPDTIMPQWVYMGYPRPQQRFFLQDECREGSITLLTNPDWLFPSRGSEVRAGDTIRLYRVRLVNLRTGERTEVPLTYTRIPRPLALGETSPSGSSGGRILFSIPRLENSAIYAVQVIRRDSVIRRAAASGPEGGTPRIDERYLRGTGVGGPAGSQYTGIVQQRMMDRLGATLVIRRVYRPSGFDVGRAVASNEKLLYAYFFRTSQYNRLQEKLRHLTVQRVDSVRVIAAFVPIVGLVCHVSSPEGFDPYDVQKQTITAAPDGRTEREYLIPPLIHVSGTDRSGLWHRLFVNPSVYDELRWVSGLPPSSSTVAQANWDWTRAVLRGYWMVSIPQTSHRPLSTVEIGAATGDPTYTCLLALRDMARMLRIRLDDGGIGGIDIRPPAAATTSFFYAQPTYVLFDLGRLTREASRLLSLEGVCSRNSLGVGPLLNREQCSRLRSIAAQQFVFPIRAADYLMHFTYSECVDPDRVASYPLRIPY
ncbi:MAG: hypothetical protein RMK93_04785 [Bacteroidota bacterium]|nr:hypothetical protein [Bacteroidota bacterium]